MKKILNWDEYFMAMAKLSAKRSKDPNTKVGACIVNKENRIIGLGYNGMPQGNDSFKWNKEGEDNKYKYVIHAEANAIMNSIKKIKGSVIYVSLFPCNECAKLIAQSEVKEVVYENHKYKGELIFDISEKILKECGVKIRQLSIDEIII
ncbi:MAG: dCMP deaminase family protein [Mycoplasma sp.]|nr:dCMP deaminase family protein [Mycoplasma sp.]